MRSKAVFWAIGLWAISFGLAHSAVSDTKKEVAFEQNAIRTGIRQFVATQFPLLGNQYVIRLISRRDGRHYSTWVHQDRGVLELDRVRIPFSVWSSHYFQEEIADTNGGPVYPRNPKLGQRPFIPNPRWEDESRFPLRLGEWQPHGLYDEGWGGWIGVNAFIQFSNQDLPPSPRPAIVEMDDTGRCTWRTAAWESSKDPSWPLTGDVILFGSVGLKLKDPSGATHVGLGTTYITGNYQIELPDLYKAPLAPHGMRLARMSVRQGKRTRLVAAFAYMPVNVASRFADPNRFRHVTLTTCQRFWADNVTTTAPRPMEALASNW